MSIPLLWGCIDGVQKLRGSRFELHVKPMDDGDGGRGDSGGFLSSGILLADGPTDVIDGGNAHTICLGAIARKLAV